MRVLQLDPEAPARHIAFYIPPDSKDSPLASKDRPLASKDRPLFGAAISTERLLYYVVFKEHGGEPGGYCMHDLICVAMAVSAAGNSHHPQTPRSRAAALWRQQSWCLHATHAIICGRWDGGIKLGGHCMLISVDVGGTGGEGPRHRQPFVDCKEVGSKPGRHCQPLGACCMLWGAGRSHA